MKTTQARTGPGSDLRRSPWLVVALVGAGVALCAWLLWTQLLAPLRTDHAERLAASAADHYAALFDSRVAELRAQLDAAASADATMAALRSDDPAQPAQVGRQLAQLLPFADRVEIFATGSADVDLEADVPITFAALRVIRAAEVEGFAGPEGTRIEPAGSRLFAARAIEDAGLPLGVLFVALSPEYLLQPLRAMAADNGRITLVQSFDGLPALALLQWGGAPAGETLEAPVQRPLAVSHWSVEFEAPTPPAVIGAGLFSTLAAGFALVLAGALVALGGWRTVRGQTAPGSAPGIADAAAPASRDDEPAAPFPGSPAPKAPPATATATGATAAADEFLDITPATLRADGDLGMEIIEETAASAPGVAFEPEIFRAYDIRGISDGNLSEEVVYWIGRALAAEALDRDQRRVVVGYDGRHSSPPLRDALARGLNDGGADVLDAGLVPTPVLYYAAHVLGSATGVMITGSHNPPEYNGLKMMIGGETLAGAAIQALRTRLAEGRLTEGHGDLQPVDVAEQYLTEITDDVVVARPLKVVVDCGNGVAGLLAPVLLERLGCDVIPLYCEVDGDFPNHHPDPAEPGNLEDLITVVTAEGADLGLAFDGDGDRIGVVSGSGRIIWPDRLLMLFAQDIVGRNPGADIIYDVKCSRHLNTLIGDLGGRPILWKTGHSHMKAKLQETQALLAGEFSGHICFGERWYGFDDALYAAARLLEIIGGVDDSVDALFERFPSTLCTPELKVATTEQAKFDLIERLVREGNFGDGTLTTIDGLRVDYADGWGLIRASNTSPVLTLRFEADDQAALERIQTLFQDQLSAIDQQLRFR